MLGLASMSQLYRRRARRLQRALALLLVFGLLPLSFAAPAQAQSVTSDPRYLQALEIATRTYVYGYPLVIMGLTQQVTTNVRDASTVLGRAPINQFSNAPQLPDQTYTDVVLPNVNTLYSLAWLDLAREPIVLSIPNLNGRFFLFEVVDAWTNVNPSSPGTRVGTQAGNYAFVGPGWRGTLPPGISGVYPMPTNSVWIIGRTYTSGAPDDISTVVNQLQPQYKLTPLNRFGKQFTPTSNAPLDNKVDMVNPPYAQIDSWDGGTFFRYFADQLRSNPPLPADAPIVADMAKIGIIPGRPFNIQALDPVLRQAVLDGAKAGNKIVNEVAFNPPEQPVNGWRYSLTLGDFGTQYVLRAATARNGVGANYFKDAVYMGTGVDGTGQKLSGANKYTLTFAAGQYPPATPPAFWSVTMYNTVSETLVANDIQRYALGIPTVQNHLPCPDASGNITLLIQNQPPDPNFSSPNLSSPANCNWLPAPAGDYLLVIRIYWPGDSLFNQSWTPPAVVRVP